MVLQIRPSMSGRRASTGEERRRPLQPQKRLRPQFADSEQKTTREIPVVALERAA
jgi:hypothetical protein